MVSVVGGSEVYSIILQNKEKSNKELNLLYPNVSSQRFSVHRIQLIRKGLLNKVNELNKTLFGASGEGSGLKQMLDGLTSLVNLINTILGPFQKLAEISRNFAESQSQVRIDVPGFSATGIVSRNTGTVVNVNVSGAVDKISTARTVVCAVNKATKTGTANKLAQSALGVGIR